MNKSVKSTLVLVCICAVISVLLALTNSITAPIIEQNQAAAADKALLQVMPNGKNFEKLDLSTYTLPATVTDAYREAGGGYVFKLSATGFSTGLIIMCGVNPDGTVSGAVCLESNETWGKEKTFGELVKGTNAQSIVDVEAGATSLTVKGYRSAVQDALNAAIILGGGSVDLRTEEEILHDNLAAALPTGDSFTKLFLVEDVTGVDAIYSAANGAGHVCVIGEQFIGVDASGVVITEDVGELATELSALIETIKATELTDVDLTQYEGIHKNVVKAQRTATGNYVLEIKGAGYGIKGGDDYHPASGEYIMIRVSMTADGRIIDCLTLSQAETKNLGDACAKEEFYGQFAGKTQSDYTDIDAISGATMTTSGYTEAIGRAFAAVQIMEGGAQS